MPVEEELIFRVPSHELFKPQLGELCTYRYWTPGVSDPHSLYEDPNNAIKTNADPFPACKKDADPD
jgi:hypothetical protein